MRDQLKKAINLVKKTGDKIIVFDGVESQDGYALMSLDEYEKMVMKTSDVRNLTEDELLDKINRDIALWKSEQITEESEKDLSSEIMEAVEEARVETKTDLPFENFSDIAGEGAQKKRWEIPKERKEGAEDVEEERQYIEPIMF